MPTVHIPEAAFNQLAEELGYQGAKQRVKDLVHDEADAVSGEDGDSNE